MKNIQKKMKATSEMFVPYVLSRFYNPKRKMKRKKAKKKNSNTCFLLRTSTKDQL